MIRSNVRNVSSVFLTKIPWMNTTKIPAQHVCMLRYAIERTCKHLLVYCPMNVCHASLTQINDMLTSYYSYVNDVAVPMHGPFFQCSVLLDVGGGNNVKDVRDNMLQYGDLEVVFFAQDIGVDMNDVNRARSAAFLPLLTSERVECDETPQSVEKESSDDVVVSAACNRYDEVVIGGTFDHIHSGHKVLVGLAAVLARKVLVVGLSVDELLAKKKHAKVLEDYAERHHILTEFVSLVNPSIVCDIEPLRDMYGPSGVRPNLEAIVVSRETEKGGHMVNDRRRENGVQQVQVVVVDLVRPNDASDDSEKLSSTQLRAEWVERVAKRNQELAEHWRALCVRLDIKEVAVVEKWLNVLTHHYNEEHRAYHTLEHIYELMTARKLATDARVQCSSLDVIDLTIWFHDVVYVTVGDSHLNEWHSADLFQEFASEVKLGEKVSQSVVRLIMATVKHVVPGDTPNDETQDMKLFLDMDLLALAKSPCHYDRYCRQIRFEYGHFSDAVFCEGRARVLSELSKKPRLFESEFYQKCEEQARLNIRRELQLLSKL